MTGHLAQTRSNGLVAMVKGMKNMAGYKVKEASEVIGRCGFY
jgi:sulfur transfer protein SufE